MTRDEYEDEMKNIATVIKVLHYKEIGMGVCGKIICIKRKRIAERLVNLVDIAYKHLPERDL